MALDTAAKRLAAINMGLPWRGPAVLADGVIGAPDRVAFLGMYGGNFATNYIITAISGVFTWTGYDATLSPTTTIDTDQERLALINMGLPWRGPKWLPIGGITKSGRSVLLNLYVTQATGPTYTITCESGVFNWEGEPSFSDFEIGANAGSFVMTGGDATLIATRTAYLNTGVFAMTGNDATLTKFSGATAVPSAGVFTMTGESVPLTYTNASGQEFPDSPPGQKRLEAGRKRRRHQVEIDGEVYEADSEAEAIYILEKVKEEALAAAQLARERALRAEKRPFRKVMQDAKKALVTPEIETDIELTDSAKVIMAEIDELYRNTLQTIEIAALLRKQEEDEEEAILLMLV